jgi:hypothetical protein
VYAFADEGFAMIPFALPTLTREPEIPVQMNVPGAVRYDPQRGEGVVCAAGGPGFRVGGQRFMALAARRGPPAHLRALGADAALTWFAMTWGCEFDPVRRRAYVNLPNLGLLAALDYDSGALLRTSFVGFGMRMATLDPLRRRLYLTNFLAGYVAAVDEATGRVLRRWQVGRFPRFSTLSRDGSQLLVGTNLGIVAIRLD